MNFCTGIRTSTPWSPAGRSPRRANSSQLPELDKERLRAAWREEVFALYLAEGKIDAAVVENMRGWPHSGFGADPSPPLAADDRAGVERLVQYIARCPFSLSRLVKVSATGQVIYRAEKAACRAFPDPHRDGLTAGTKRNFQVLSAVGVLGGVHAAHSARKART